MQQKANRHPLRLPPLESDQHVLVANYQVAPEQEDFYTKIIAGCSLIISKNLGNM